MNVIIETDLDPVLLTITITAVLLFGVTCIWFWISSQPKSPKKQTQPARSAAFRKVATDYEGEVYPDSKQEDEAPARRRKKDGSDGVVTTPSSVDSDDRGDSADTDAGTGGGGNSDGAGGADGGGAGGGD